MKRQLILIVAVMMTASSLGCHHGRNRCCRPGCSPYGNTCGTTYGAAYGSCCGTAPAGALYGGTVGTGFGSGCTDCSSGGVGQNTTYDDAYLAPPSVNVMPGPIVN